MPGPPPPAPSGAPAPPSQYPSLHPGPHVAGPAAPDAPPVGKPVPTPLGPQIGSAAPPPDKKTARKRARRWPGIVFPILFLALAAIIVWLVLDLSEMFHSYSAPPPAPAAPGEPSKAPAPPNAKARALATRARASTRQPVPITNARHPVNPNTVEPVRNEPPRNSKEIVRVAGEVPLPPEIDLSSDGAPAKTPRQDARASPPPPAGPSQTLARFLAARTLEDRRPCLSRSSRSDAELKKSCLAGPLPPVIHQRMVHYMEDQTEQHREQFFEVAFQKDDAQRPSYMLVQLSEWGDGVYHVHTDAFIDLFDDALGEFAKHPSADPRTFHAVADAYKHCFDDSIPNPETKSFIKLRCHPRITPRLKAYFDQQSNIAAEIARPEGLPWGSTGICTVTVKWNTSVPGRPYVELVDLVGFTWNP